MKIREEAWLKDWEDWSKKVWPEYYEEKDNDEQLHRQKIY